MLLRAPARIRLLAVSVYIVSLLFPPVSWGQEADAIFAATSSYRVLAGDILSISVWKELELQREVLVRPDGGISFPLAGDIQAAGKTVPELQLELSGRLSQFIPDAVVTVTVEDVQGNQVYVLGQVANPGAYVMNPRLDVLQVLAIAGGTTAFASLNDIKIFRRIGNEQTVLDFRYNDVADGEDLYQNILLQTGDTIVVP